MLFHWDTLTEAQPRKLERDPQLAAYLLTPGFSRSYHQHVLRTSNATIWKYMAWARELARRDPKIDEMVSANVGSITRDDAIQMAQRRGPCQLPFWSRLAVCECLLDTDAGRVAVIFGCSKRTLVNIRVGRCVSYDPITGARITTAAQNQLSSLVHPRGL